MGVVERYTINSPKLENKLLIATQQSEYKDEITQTITSLLKDKNVYISVIDVTELNKSLINEFDAFILIHTYEMSRPPIMVNQFLENQELKNKVFTISTSGSGDLQIEGVDGFSSASVILDSQKEANLALEWINNHFENE